jgi:hypothetical protein
VHIIPIVARAFRLFCRPRDRHYARRFTEANDHLVRGKFPAFEGTEHVVADAASFVPIDFEAVGLPRQRLGDFEDVKRAKTCGQNAPLLTLRGVVAAETGCGTRLSGISLSAAIGYYRVP